MDYAYPCMLTPDEEGSSFVVNFPDVPEAITGGATREESLILAENALVVALSMYVDAHEDIPTPSAPAGGQDPITVPPQAAAQLALYTAMRHEGKTTRDLAQSLGIRESRVRRLLDLGRPSRLDQILRALRSLGRTLVVRDDAAPRADPARAATG